MLRMVVALVLVLFSFSCTAGAVDKIIVFGDSLSDSGNFYSYSLHIVPKNPPYFNGRFSNGLTWVECLADGLHLNHESKDQLLNLAYGGATARPEKNDIAWQIKTYFKKFPNDANGDKHLYVIWIGGNDYLPAKGSTDDVTTEAVASIRRQMNLLIQHGAKNFLVLNLPDLGKTPLAQVAGPEYAAKVSRMIQLHNAKLTLMLSHLRVQHSKTDVVFFDVTNPFQDALTHPQKYGIKYTQDACFKGDTFMFSVLKDPKYDHVREQLSDSDRIVFCALADEYFFFDHVHPTRVVHELIAKKVLERLNKSGYGA